jgi:hypothetical protein
MIDVAFNIISGLITIASFVFAIWIWIHSKTTIRELSQAVRTIYEIAKTAVWESEAAVGDEQKLQVADRMLGYARSVLKITAPYCLDRERSLSDSDMGQLLERRIVWNLAMLMQHETAREVTEVWVVSHDLKPDSSNKALGNVVAANIKQGKRYVFFFLNRCHTGRPSSPGCR